MTPRFSLLGLDLLGPVLVGMALSGAGLNVAEAQTRARTLSTDELIDKHVQARGGAAALKAIHAVKMTGTMRPAGFDVQMTYEEIVARPGSIRINATLQGLTVVQAYDGASGWQIQPFQGRKDPESVSADDVKSLAEEADFDGTLIDYKAKGATIDNLGAIDVDGAPAWALRVSLKNGDQMTYYLDPDAFLTVRVITRQVLRGAEVFTQTDYGDYEKVSGVYFPMEVASGPKGSSAQTRVTYDAIVANPSIDASMFGRPAAPATSSAR